MDKQENGRAVRMGAGAGPSNGIPVRWDAITDALADLALRSQVSQANVDPALIVAWQETSVERLARYLEHVTLNKAARRIIARLVVMGMEQEGR